VTIPSTGSRHAYYVNLTANVGDTTVTADGTNVGTMPEATVIGPSFGQPQSTLASGAHTIVFDDTVTALTFSVNIVGAGGATLYVLEGARNPPGSQRPIRLTPLDLSTFPPTAGAPISPN
jgi:hypothetical protein